MPLRARADRQPIPYSVPGVAGAAVAAGELVGYSGGLLVPAAVNVRIIGVAQDDALSGQSCVAMGGLQRIRNSITTPCTDSTTGHRVFAESPLFVTPNDAVATRPFVGLQIGLEGGDVWVLCNVASALLSGGPFSGGSYWHAQTRVDPVAGNNDTGAAFYPGRPFRTVQAAVDANFAASTMASTSIVLAPGAYPERVTIRPPPSAQSMYIYGYGPGTNVRGFRPALDAMATTFYLTLADMSVGFLLSPSQPMIDMLAPPPGSPVVFQLRGERLLLHGGPPVPTIVRLQGATGTRSIIDLHECTLWAQGGADVDGIRADSGTVLMQQCNLTPGNGTAACVKANHDARVLITNSGVTPGVETIEQFQLADASSLVLAELTVGYVATAIAHVIAGNTTGRIQLPGALFERGPLSAAGINTPNARVEGLPLDTAGSIPIIAAASIARYLGSEWLDVRVANPALWAASPPFRQQDFNDRVAAAVSGLLGGPIP